MRALPPRPARRLQVEQITDRRARVSVEPLDPGYGATLGTALRRILLSSISGLAITEVAIDGVAHAFAAVAGAHEDLPAILSNLRAVAVRGDGQVGARLTLDFLGPGDVRAEHLLGDARVSVVNPGQRICTLGSATRLRMQLWVERGRGFVPAPARRQARDLDAHVGRFHLDASFTPIRQVAYVIENIGDVAGSERLILDITTNGAVDVLDAVHTAASIFADQLSIFGQFLALERADRPRLAAFDPQWARPLGEFGFSPRSFTAMKAAGIHSIRDLLGYSALDLLMTPRFGRTGIDNIQATLAVYGLSLAIAAPRSPTLPVLPAAIID